MKTCMINSAPLNRDATSIVTETPMIPHQAYVIAQKFELLPTNCKEKASSTQIATFLGSTFKELIGYLDDALGRYTDHAKDAIE